MFDNVNLTNNMDEGIKIYSETQDAILIDVRNKDEYDKGHVPSSVNIPLNSIENDIYDVALDTETPLFLYCITGSRSLQAAIILRDMGYYKAVCIGGLDTYKGELEK